MRRHVTLSPMACLLAGAACGLWSGREHPGHTRLPCAALPRCTSTLFIIQAAWNQARKIHTSSPAGFALTLNL